MKRIFLTLGIFILAAITVSPPRAIAQNLAPDDNLSAAAWVIADSTSGFVLDSFNAKREMQIGSITKVATAMVVLDWARTSGEALSELATVPGTVHILQSPNSMGLQPGDTISLRDALYAALLQSDNEAAETLAAHVGRRLGVAKSERDAVVLFVAQMNALARSLGMRNTRFLNPHGLDDLEKKLPYSTAGDVALLTNHGMSQTGFVFYVSQKERKITWTAAMGEQRAYLLKNTNELVGTNGVDGVKTGTTRRAGACLSVSAFRPPESKKVGEDFNITPRRLTVVVLNAPSRFEVAKSLLGRGWALHEQWSRAGRPVEVRKKDSR